LALVGCGDALEQEGTVCAASALSGTVDVDDETNPAELRPTCCSGFNPAHLELDDQVFAIDELQVLAYGHLWAHAGGVVRFGRQAGRWVSTLNGSTLPLQTGPHDLLWYQPGSDRPNVTESSVSYLACAHHGQERIDGVVARCLRSPPGTPDVSPGAHCTLGTFTALRVARRPGEPEHSANVTLLGEYSALPVSEPVGPVTANVRVDPARGLAMLARMGDGLRILQLRGGGPVAVGHGPTEDAEAEIYNDVKLLDVGGRSFALAASSTHGVVVWDTSDPTRPQVVAHLNDGDDIHTVFLDGTTLYAADLSLGGLLTADLGDPLHPRELGQLLASDPNPGRPAVFLHDLYVAFGRAYLAYWGAGLIVADVSDPSAPRELGRYRYPRDSCHSVWVAPIDGRLIAVIGDEDFGAHARVLDVTDPTGITLVGEWGQDRPQVSIHNILIQGDRAYVAWYQDGLRILQLSAKEAPRQIGWFNTWQGGAAGQGLSFFEGAIGIDVHAGVAYLADTDRGLFVLSVP
jgi:hypothetical protein